MLFVNLNKAFNAFLHLSTQVPDHVPGGSAGVTLLPAVCEDQASLGSGAATGVCVRVQENTEWPPLAGGGGGWSTHQRAALVVMDAAMQPFSVM